MDPTWSVLCPTGIHPWLPGTRQLAPCFQQLCLQLPVFVLFAMLSAYQFGRLYGSAVQRDRVQTAALRVRTVVTALLAILPAMRLYALQVARAAEEAADPPDPPSHLWPADVLAAGAECMAFAVHAGYLLSLRRRGSCNHRGTLGIRVLWITVFMLTTIWTRADPAPKSSVGSLGVLAVLLHCVYLLTLAPLGTAERIAVHVRNDELQSLLHSNRYVRFRDDNDELALGHAQDEAGLLSRLAFVWVNPLIKKGVAGYLRRIDDLFMLPACLDVTAISDRMRACLVASGRLFGALHRAHGVEFYGIGALRLVSDMAGFAGPLLLGGLLSHSVAPADDVEGGYDERESDWQAYLYALGLFASSLIAAISGTHFNWRIAMVTMRLRVSLVTAIYTKALEARTLDDAQPDVLNLMSTDTDRIVNSCVSFHSFWSIPFQLLITLYLLYTQVGVAFLAGVAFAVALIPLNRWIAVRIGHYSERLMRAKDARIAVATETLTNAKNIKLLAWEDVFGNKIKECRRTEIEFLGKRKYLDALCVYFWATTPVLMSLLTFGVSSLLGQRMEPASTFTTVALLNMLIGPLNAFPWVLNGIVEAWVSLRRVQELIDLPNIEPDTFYSPLTTDTPPSNTDSSGTGAPKTPPPIIELHAATFQFDRDRSRAGDLQNDGIVDFRLDAVNLTVRAGDLICVDGPVGSGKSALLEAILGRLHLHGGEVCMDWRRHSVGYVSQSAWLQRGTVRENIVWGAVWDEQKYKQVLYACALIGDLNVLGGDQLGIGEGGQTLSGGQKARVALARAVYQDKQVYFLDDILSALDAPVAQHIVQHCVLGLLRHKTRICITEHATLHNHAHRIVRVDAGGVRVRDGPLSSSCESLYEPDHQETEQQRPDAEQLDLNESVIELSSVDSVLMEETRETGTLSADVFRAYARAMGSVVGVVVLLSVVTMQVTRNVSDLWLAHWVSSNVSGYEARPEAFAVVADDTTASTFYLQVYGGLALGNSMVTLVRAFVFAYAGIRAARFIHDRMLNSVLFARFQFFDITPLGRILNRFSSDTYTIDDSLPFILNVLLAQLAALIGSIGIALFAQPWLALLVVPLAPIYLNLQSRYRHAARDIRRLSSNALSPLYAHFTETLQGLRTIRAMDAAPRFRRDFIGKLEECTRAQLTAAAAQQWLAIRLQMIGALVVGGCGLVAAVTGSHATDPGLVGLAVSYALSITGLLGGVLSAMAETEQELIAVERVNKYCHIEPEHNAAGSAEPPFGWPCQGVVRFDGATLQYREYLPAALQHISLQTVPCERVGVAGRTGAGKSSLVAALFRVTPLQAGSITVDCVNIATLKLAVLRGRMALVPQQPFLFAGTVRENMDPRGFHLDSKIWQALGECMATQLVQSLGGLNALLESNGRNLSAGQKQLLCLARALLKNAKVVCIDEGTANLDADSETAIQLVLRNAFRASTVLLIAHRTTSLQNTDRVVVMQAGRIVEQGAAVDLAADEASVFHSMLMNQRVEELTE